MISENGRSLKIVGLALSIPFLLTAGPLVGLEAGWFLAERGWPHATPPVLAGLGFLAGVFEAFKIARRALQIESKKKDV